MHELMVQLFHSVVGERPAARSSAASASPCSDFSTRLPSRERVWVCRKIILLFQLGITVPAACGSCTVSLSLCAAALSSRGRKWQAGVSKGMRAFRQHSDLPHQHHFQYMRMCDSALTAMGTCISLSSRPSLLHLLQTLTVCRSPP